MEKYFDAKILSLYANGGRESKSLNGIQHF